ncbi:heterokaryon incompatibility protein-domain-containing protein [Podospora conica]|nr:heterokaryon incompatibility protein-domain-containing protein [Schizothecium conicum]
MPASSPLYASTPLPSPHSIRLLQPLHDSSTTSPLHLSYHLQPFDLTSPALPPFTALSYNWGSPDIIYRPDPDALRSVFETTAAHEITCNGHALPVRRNLFRALVGTSFTRVPRGGWLWIDAVCIDQGNVEEREGQVRLMAGVYGAAEGVLAWVGDQHPYAGVLKGVVEALEGLGRVVRTKGEWEEARGRFAWLTFADFLEPEAYADLGTRFITLAEWKAWLAFVARPYFRRAWIVQEVLKARRVDLVMGLTLIPWDAFERAVYFIESVGAWGSDRITDEVLRGIRNSMLGSDDEDGEGGSELPLDDWHMLLVVDELGAKRHVSLVLDRNPDLSGLGTGGGGLPLDVLLERHRDTEATDPRDKIYAFLGLASDAAQDGESGLDGLQVDYRAPVALVYTRTARYLCSLHGDLRILRLRESNSERRVPGLPSWVPDFSARHSCGAMDVGTGDGGGWTWAASPAKWRIDSRSLDERELAVRGRCIGALQSTVESLERHNWDRWANLFAALVSIPEGTHDSLLELVARTLTRDTLSGVSPAPEIDLAKQALNQFIDICLNCLNSGLEIDQQEEYVTMLACLGRDLSSIGFRLATLATREPYGSEYGWGIFMPKLKETIYRWRRGATVYRNVTAGHETRAPATDEKTREVELPQLQRGDFDRQSRSSLNQRCFFMLEGGQMLGLGPEDARSGDQLWVLDGAKTPVVLRRVGDTSYEFLGEAYVHGMMHGEAVARFPVVEDVLLPLAFREEDSKGLS